MTASSTKVVIDLSNLGLVAPIKDATHLIQQSVFNALRSRISEDLVATKSGLSRRREFPGGSGLTYFIDGTRGAGKSTFLQYAYTHLSENLEGVALKALVFLDPSRIERSELVLLHVLKHLKRLAKPAASQGLGADQHWVQFNRLVAEMAGGLHLFVADNSQLKDLDAELFLEYGLERAADSQKLREKLHQAIDLVCTIQGVDALLIAVDDADTDAQSAIDTLECIRKYLDTPRLVILVTGDMEMYSLLVQNHFVSTFARSSKELNQDRHRQQLRMVDHLEEQYLLKIFPLTRRAQLKTLWSLSKDDPENYQVNSSGTIYPVHKWVSILATEGLRVRSATDQRLFKEFLLKQPVRSILQVLSIFTSKKDNAKAKIDACSVALRSMALSSLYQYGVDVDEIAAGELNALTEAVFDLSLRDGDSDTGAYLRPQPRDAALRNSFVALAADVARICQCNLADSLTYILGGPGSVSVYFQVARAHQKNALDANEKESLIRLFKQYLSIGRKEDALNWAWRATVSLVNTSQSTKVIRQGIVGLRKRVEAKDRAAGVEVLAIRDAIDQVVQNTDFENYPAHAFSLIDVTSPGGIGLYASIYNILGLMGRLLRLDASAGDMKSEVAGLLRPLITGLTISPPDWTGGNAVETLGEAAPQSKASRSTKKEDGGPTLASSEEEKLQAMAGHIVEWLKYCEKLQTKVTPSAAFLGKVWTRLYFSLSQASESIRTSSAKEVDQFSSAMEIFAWCVINAFLVEENDHHVVEESSDLNQKNLDRKNPATSAITAAKKFDGLQEKADQQLPMTYAIASCPLILGLLENDAKSSQILKISLKKQFGLIDNFIDKSFCMKSAWNLMAKALIAGKNEKPATLRKEKLNSKNSDFNNLGDSSGDISKSDRSAPDSQI